MAVAACLAVIVWSGYGRDVPLRDPFILSLLLLPVAVLGGMQARPVLYSLGLLCLLLAFAGTWLASPGGSQWVARNVLQDAAPDPYGGLHRFGGMLFLFPVAWILLARSVSTWKIALASYLAPGLLWALAVVIANWASSTRELHPPEFWVQGVLFGVQLFLALLVLWPSYMLGFLNLFGLHFFD